MKKIKLSVITADIIEKMKLRVNGSNVTYNKSFKII